MHNKSAELLVHAEKLSRLLNAGLNQRQLKAALKLLQSGVEPEAIVEAVKSLRKLANESASESCMHEGLYSK
jgi:hypothetical protein